MVTPLRLVDDILLKAMIVPILNPNGLKE